MSRANSYSRRRAAASSRGRRMARARWSRPHVGEPTADTMRGQALRDAKGRILREGITYHGDGRTTPWQIRRSLHGRTNQLDIVAAGQIHRTLGRRRLSRIFPGALPELGISPR